MMVSDEASGWYKLPYSVSWDHCKDLKKNTQLIIFLSEIKQVYKIQSSQIYVCLACLFVCLNPKNVNTAEPIWSTFIVGQQLILG